MCWLWERFIWLCQDQEETWWASDQEETRASVLLAANTESLQHCSQLEGSLLKMCNICFSDYGNLKMTTLSMIEAVAEKLRSADISVPSPKRP